MSADAASAASRGPSVDELRAADAATLAGLLAGGRPIDPAALAGWQFHGTSLGLPAWVERLSWTWFVKAFVRGPGGTVRGWNVRVDQRHPWQARRRHGLPVTFGHFEVVRDGDRVVLDYGRGGNRRLDPVRALRDPLVALDADATRLLGRSLLAIGRTTVPTPSYFVLERGPAVDHVAAPPR